MTIRVAVVDDEPLAREGIRELLAGEADLEVVAEARDGREALDLLSGEEVDLLFLDVQMPGLDGFEVLRRARRLPPAVVFVTAFDEYAVRAFEVHAVDYLIKPVRRARFRAAVERARERLAGREEGSLRRRLRDLLSDLEAERAPAPGPALHTGEGSHLIRMTMTELAERLEPRGFVRIHRSFIVRLDRIESIRPWARGDHLVVLRGGRELPLTRTYRPALEEKLGHPI